MPYKVVRSARCPASKPWAVIKIPTGEKMGCHKTKQDGLDQVAAIEANEDK